jgi:hypothetical protein
MGAPVTSGITFTKFVGVVVLAFARTQIFEVSWHTCSWEKAVLPVRGVVQDVCIRSASSFLASRLPSRFPSCLPSRLPTGTLLCVYVDRLGYKKMHEDCQYVRQVCDTQCVASPQ